MRQVVIGATHQHERRKLSEDVSTMQEDVKSDLSISQQVV